MGTSVRTLRAWLNRGWQVASMYLPVVVMAFLAGGVYWLVHITPEPTVAQADQPPRVDPDYFMRGVAMQRFDAQGVPRSRLWGDEARHYPVTGELEVDNVRLQAVGEDGQVLLATAERGVANSDYSELKLYGAARVVRLADAQRGPDGDCVVRPRVELRSEFLHVYVDEKRVVTDQPSELLRDNARILSDKLEMDERAQQALFEGRVRTQLPARASAPAGSAEPACAP